MGTDTTKFKKICGCGFETTTKTEKYTKCPECGDNTNWEFYQFKEEE